MGQSFTRKLKRGNLVAIWNNTFKGYDFFAKIKKGGYGLTRNPFGNTIGTPGPGHHIKTIAKWQKQSRS